ncbi:hypothetical protein scyTo_0027936, partial [Scyliorhinus torazame]|nr:hypothetical protein [Scyliorhinus torazame]
GNDVGDDDDGVMVMVREKGKKGERDEGGEAEGGVRGV